MSEVQIQAMRNGPYVVRGPITLTDYEGRAYAVPEGRPVALCRCGQSGRKPFCDGTHGSCDFQAEERAPAE